MSRGNGIKWFQLKIEFQPCSAFSFEMLYATYSLDKCLLLCEVSQKSARGISRYLGMSIKRNKLCMHWRLDSMHTNLLLFGCFWKGFITHSFCKWPLYTLQPTERVYASRLPRFWNTWKRMNQGKKCCTLFVISQANFKKTAIKTKFVDRFFKTFFSTLIDHCTTTLF